MDVPLHPCGRVPPESRRLALRETSGDQTVEETWFDALGRVEATRVVTRQDGNSTARTAGCISSLIADLVWKRSEISYVVCGRRTTGDFVNNPSPAVRRVVTPQGPLTKFYVATETKTYHGDELGVRWVVELDNLRGSVASEILLEDLPDFSVVGERRGSEGDDEDGVGRLTRTTDRDINTLTLSRSALEVESERRSQRREKKHW